MKLTKALLLLQLTFFLVTTPIFAQQAENKVKAKFLVEGGVEFGGDEILKVLFTNGSDQAIRAGQGGIIAIGGQLEFEQVKNLLIRTSIGLKYTTTAAEDANIRFTRYPFYLTPLWKIKEDFRVGVGITAHQAVNLRGDGFFPDVNFKSKMGPRFEVGWKWIALTYASLNYTIDGEEPFSANSVGLSVSFAFPQNKK